MPTRNDGHDQCLTDLCITMSAERRNDQRDLKHADHAHACAQRYTRVLPPPHGVCIQCASCGFVYNDEHRAGGTLVIVLHEDAQALCSSRWRASAARSRNPAPG